MSFGTILRELREEHSLNQKQLADACKLSTQCISALETGTRNPTGSTIKVLAQFFGVSADYLLGLEDDFGHKSSDDIIKRPKYDITDKQLQDLVKLFGVMTELQKAHVIGYIIAYLEREGINVGKVLGY